MVDFGWSALAHLLEDLAQLGPVPPALEAGKDRHGAWHNKQGKER